MTIDLFEKLERHAASRPGDIALQTLAGGAAESITFRGLIERSRALSEVIRNAAIEPGERAGLLLANNHQFGIAFFAAASAGAVIVPLDPSYDADRLCAVITHAECRLLIHAGHFPELASAIRDRLPDLEILDARAAPVQPELPPWPLSPRDPDDDFLLMYTGGTTGAPKGVRLTLRGVTVTIRDTLAVFPLDAGDHVLSILPLFHIMAIQANLLGPLYAGSRISYLETRDPQAIVNAFRDHEITAFLCVPLFYYQLHRRIFGEIARQSLGKRVVFRALLKFSRFLRTAFGWNAGRLFFRPVHQRFGSRLRGFGVGAARFAPEIAADLHDLGFAFFQGYGMTETSGLATISPMSLRGGLSSGPALKNLEVRIDAPDTQGHGAVLLRGENIMKGYWKDAQATDAALVDGWLRTGDIGYVSLSNLHIVGREKEVIVLSSGKNIFPEPLETWFQSRCPLIQEMCVFAACENGAGAERLHALVVPDAAKLRELQIVNIREALGYQIDNLNRSLPAHEKLNGFDVRFEPLPRTSSRKLRRFRIQEEASRTRNNDSPCTVTESSPAESGGMAVVREIIAHIKPGREIHPGSHLELDLSFDSLERVELLASVEEAFGIRIDTDQAASIFVVADILTLAPQQAPSHAAKTDWSSILHEPLSESERATADRYLGGRPLAAPVLFVATRIFCWIARVLLRFRARIPREWSQAGPLIFCANHQSFLDFPLLAGCLPYSVFRRLFSLSATRLQRSRFQSWFGRTVRSLPIDPDRNPRAALRIAVEGLRRGMILCVFPEGHRSIDGELQSFRKGAAIVAVESGADVLPVGVQGTGRVWGRASKGIHLAPVSIATGAPIRPERGDDYESFNERLRSAVRQLIF